MNDQPNNTLGDQLTIEIKRCRELVEQYRVIGPAGDLGRLWIEQDIKNAEEATRSGDVIAMMRAYQMLKECK